MLCAAVLSGLGWLAGQAPGFGLLPALILLPLVAWPCWLGLAYRAAVRRVLARAVLREDRSPWWAPLLGGALWRQILAVPVALLAAWTVAWTLIVGGWQGWAGIAVTAMLLWPVAWLIRSQMEALRPHARLRAVLAVAPVAVAGVMTMAGLAMTALPAPGRLADQVATQGRYEGPSALLAWATDATGLLQGARLWGLGLVAEQAWPVAMLWQGTMTFGQAWLVATVFAGLLLPAGEARRILRPSDAPVVPPVASGRAALAAAVLTVLGLAFVSALAQAESWAAARSGLPLAQAPEGPAAPGIGGVGPYPAMAQAPPAPFRQAPGLPDPSSLRRSVEAEQIGAMLCPEGTMHALASLDREAAALQQARRHAAERAVREAFAAMRARVPAFLDAYYSLSAEYLRTLNWLAGDAQRYLERQMSEALAMEDSAASIAPALTRLAEGVPRDLLRQRERLLDRCRILPSDGEAAQVVAMAPAALLEVPEALAGIPLEARLGAAGLGTMAGGIAGALAGKLVAKIAAKEVFALATEALAKLALGKAAGGLGGAAAGAAAGAAVGSIVPGFGTTIGAIAGGIAGGLAIGVATDWALLRLDEMISREAFEAEILSAIDEAERELLAAIGVLPDAAPRPQNP